MAGSRRVQALIWLQVLVASVALGTPLYPYDQVFTKRAHPIVSDANGTTTIFDPSTHQSIAQGPATDGGGTQFSTTALIWLVFAFVIGVPLALGGIRLWRFTSGCGPGLALTAAIWAAFINTETANGVAELTITLVPSGGFVIGFGLGTLDLCRTAAVLILGIAGGMAFAIRIMIIRPDLLVHNYWWNWFLTGAFGLFGLVATLSRQRLGITIASASIGTFLVGLGIDLIVEHQDGISLGLRFLFDRNSAHYQDLVLKGWTPSTTTYIILAVSLGLTFPLAYAQHRLFPGPFSRKRYTEVYTSSPRASSLYVASAPASRPESDQDTAVREIDLGASKVSLQSVSVMQSHPK